MYCRTQIFIEKYTPLMLHRYHLGPCWMAKAITLVRTYEKWGVYEVLYRRVQKGLYLML
jgi:hypothetical protein